MSIGQSQLLAGAQSAAALTDYLPTSCAKPLPAGVPHPRTLGACVLTGVWTFVVSNNSKVLIVDDERPISDTLALILSTNDYETRVAYSAERALEICAEWLPDLAIIDVALPGISGIDLAIVLTAQYPTCRLLLFSGNASTGDLLTDAANKGYTFDILAKPVHPTVILEKTAELLASSSIRCA